MKTSFLLAAAVVALTAALTQAGGTLGSGPMAATAPSRIDSSAGSVMGPAAPANSTSDGPQKPGSIPSGGSEDPDGTTKKTTRPGMPDSGGVDGGVAGGFQTNDPDKKNSSASSSSGSTKNTVGAANASTSAPAPAKTSGTSSISLAASVVTVVSVASTTAALVW